jgi:hypothetical protein
MSSQFLFQYICNQSLGYICLSFDSLPYYPQIYSCANLQDLPLILDVICDHTNYLLLVPELNIVYNFDGFELGQMPALLNPP